MKASLVLQSLRAKALELDELYKTVSRQRDAIHEVIAMYEQDTDEMHVSGDVTYKEELTDTIESILQEEHPLHRSEILDKVREKGIYIGGASPLNSLSSYLSTDPRFKTATGKGMWTLVVNADADTITILSAEHNNPQLRGLDYESGMSEQEPSDFRERITLN